MKKITIMFCTLFVIAVLTLTNSTLIKADTIKENATVEFTCEHPLIDGSTDAEIASQRDFTKGYTCKLDLGNDFTSETDFYPAGTTIELSNAGSYIYTLESVTPGSTNLDESVATIDGNTITLNEDVVDSEGLGTSLSLGIKVNFADFQKEDFSVTKAKKTIRTTENSDATKEVSLQFYTLINSVIITEPNKSASTLSTLPMETDGFASFSGSDLTIEGEPEIIVDPATKEFTQEIVVTNSGLHPLPLNELIISSYSFGEGKNYEITIDGKTIEEFVIESENIFMPGESYTVTVKGLYNGEEKLNLRIGQIMSYLGDSVKLTNQSEGFYSYDFIYTESTLAIEEPTIEEEAVTQETNDEPIQTAQNMEGAQVLATGVDDFIPLAIVIVTTLLGIIIRLRFVNSK